MPDDDPADPESAMPSSLQVEFFSDLIARVIPGSVFIFIVSQRYWDTFKDLNNWVGGTLITFSLVLACVIGTAIDVLVFEFLRFIAGEKALLDYTKLRKEDAYKERRLEKNMAEISMFRNLGFVLLVAPILSFALYSLKKKSHLSDFLGCYPIAPISFLIWYFLRRRAKVSIARVHKK